MIEFEKKQLIVFISPQSESHFKRAVSIITNHYIGLSHAGQMLSCSDSEDFEQMEPVIKQIKEWRVAFLCFNRQEKRKNRLYQKTILKKISHINFSQLTQLNLSSNLIESIQQLSHFFAPNLKRILLMNNLIVKISIIRKGCWPFLSQLQIVNNRIREVQKLSEIKWGNYFTIQFQESQSERVQVQDIRNLIKMEAQAVFRIQIQHPSRISQLKTESNMKRKWGWILQFGEFEDIYEML